MGNTEIPPRAKFLTSYAPWLSISIDGKETQFISPLFGPVNYRDTGKAILQAGFHLPTGKETAYYLDEVYNSPVFEIRNNLQAREVKNAMKMTWIWNSTKNLYTSHGPENEQGIYLARDAKAIGSSAKLDRAELEKMLDPKIEVEGVKFSADYSVAFVPEQTYFNKPFNNSNGYLIAKGEGKEGAEALVRVSKNPAFMFPSQILLSNVTENDFERVSALGGGYEGRRLCIDGDYWIGGDRGFAFGVLRNSAEGSAPKIYSR